MGLFTPFDAKVNHRHVHLSDVSKAQLAKTVNEQAETIQRLDQSVKVLGRILLAIARTPDSLRTEAGTVVVAALAITDVQAGTQLLMETLPNGDVRLAVKEVGSVPPQEIPVIETPQ